MAWKERSRVDERVLLVAEYVKGERSMAELCREFGISRKTAYKWLARYTAEGPSSPTSTIWSTAGASKPFGTRLRLLSSSWLVYVRTSRQAKPR